MFLQLHNLRGYRRLAHLALTGDGRKGPRLHHPYQDPQRAPRRSIDFLEKTQKSFKGKRGYLAEARRIRTVYRIPALRPGIDRAAVPLRHHL